jgi:hypothetical protein
MLDGLSDVTGFAAIRVPLQRASHPNEVTLNVPGYRQIDSYSCGAVAAAMAIKFLRPRINFDRVHATVDPCPEQGAGTRQVMRALRSLGIEVDRRTNLTFTAICKAIDAKSPVLACVKTADPMTTHWVVIYGYGYGYGRRPSLVFVAGQGLPFVANQRVNWADFRQQWSPAGLGLVCRGAKRKIVRPRRRFASP